MFVGERYAQVFKAVAICLIYAPLWPLSYSLCVASLLAQYAANKFCLAFWWKRPESVDDDLLAKMRRSFGYLIGFQSAVTLVGESIARPERHLHGGVAARVAVVVLVWLGFLVVPWRRLQLFSKYQGGMGTTDGIAYDEVSASKGYAIEQYRCPMLPKHPTDSDLHKACKRYAQDHMAEPGLVRDPEGAAKPNGPRVKRLPLPCVSGHVRSLASVGRRLHIRYPCPSAKRLPSPRPSMFARLT
eukprot:2281626-Prymnesium_polylepis.1